jgi:hypothetical protein
MPLVLIVLTIAALFGIGTYFLKPQTEVATQPVVGLIEESPLPTDQVRTSEEPAPTVVTVPNQTAAPVPENEVASIPAVVRPTPTPPAPISTPDTPAPTPVVATKFKNASYNATTNYTAPGRTNHIVAVQMTISDDIVTNVSVAYSGDPSSQSSQYQSRFSNSIESQVIGKSLDTISLSRVGGASLTTGAFNQAITNIKNQART